MRSVLSFFSMLALGLMIAAMFVVAPGTPTTNVGGFEVDGPALDYRSVIAGLGIGLVIAIVGHISWGDVARRCSGAVVSQARRLWLIGWACVFAAVIVYF